MTGNPGLHEMLQLRLDVSLWGSQAAQQEFLAQMRAEWQERLERSGDAVCVLEPQVKEGPGGLRDLHAVLWVAHARYRTRGLAALETAGLLEPADYAAVRRAYDFLLRVRNQVHFTTGRKTDLLALDLQADLADRLGYRARGGNARLRAADARLLPARVQAPRGLPRLPRGPARDEAPAPAVRRAAACGRPRSGASK